MNAVPHSIAAQPAPSSAVAQFLKRTPRLFINNEWVEPKSAARIPVFDPATGKEIAQVVDANASDVDRAVAARVPLADVGVAIDDRPVSGGRRRKHERDEDRRCERAGELLRHDWWARRSAARAPFYLKSPDRGQRSDGPPRAPTETRLHERGWLGASLPANRATLPARPTLLAGERPGDGATSCRSVSVTPLKRGRN